MRYQIEIRTSERTGAGTDARVFLSLAGDKYAMAEAEIDDPITANDWERGDVNSLFIESDMMDRRVVSEAQLKNRIDAFFEGLVSRRNQAASSGA